NPFRHGVHQIPDTPFLKEQSPFKVQAETSASPSRSVMGWDIRERWFRGKPPVVHRFPSLLLLLSSQVLGSYACTSMLGLGDLKMARANCLRAAGLGLCVFMLCACAGFSPEVPPEASAEPQKGYIFARLTLQQINHVMPFLKGGETLALALDSDGGQRLLMEFSDDPAKVCVVEAPPGSYRVVGVVMPPERDLFGVNDPDARVPFQVEAGQAYYVGDYKGTVRSDWRPMGFLSRGYLNTIRSNDQTIADFKAAYADLGKLPTASPLHLSR
ncbi:MAG: hypothetical protein ACM3ZT_11085, partial [Bacillota bacterium]